MGAGLGCSGIRDCLKQTIKSARFEVQTAVTVKCDAVQSGRDVLIFSVNKHKIIYSNESTNQMKQLITGLLLVVQIQLNLFRASSCPSSGTYKLQQQPLV